ncbi:MAG: hypothetical protein WCC74_00155 [Minisyncoccia bacterium]
MEQKFQTSFIPKKSVMPDLSSRPSIGLFLLISIILLLISFSIAAYVYLEKQTLISKIANAKVSIEKNKNNFETATIEDIVRLDARIKVAEGLISRHISVSPIFKFIEDHTLRNVRFKGFNFSIGGTNISSGSAFKIVMSGQAKDFKTLALQADEFGKIEYRNIIKDTVFSSLDLAANGNVGFSFSASIIPDFIKYENRPNFK